MSTLKWWEKMFVAVASIGLIGAPIAVSLMPVAAPAINEGMQQVQRVVDAIPKPCSDLKRGDECNAFEAREPYESNGLDGGLPSCRCPPVQK